MNAIGKLVVIRHNNLRTMDFPYKDMLELPHHVSRQHSPMPRSNRAAQFAPFAALTGYESLLVETARVTEPRRELSEASRAQLDARLQFLLAHLGESPVVEIEHFVPDATKAGGQYVRSRGQLVRISSEQRQLLLADGTSIALADIVSLESEILGNLESMG